MDFLLRVLKVLPTADWAAVAVFFGAWIFYVMAARQKIAGSGSLVSTANAIRFQWMRQTAVRDVRVFDGIVVQNLSSSPSFFASTAIFVIGGLVAALGAGDKANEFVQEIPFAARTSALVLDLKILLLIGIYINAFFSFTWSMRQYSFGALMVAAAPDREIFLNDEDARNAFAASASRMMGLAAETFNNGVRAVYLSFAAMLWFFSPWALMAGTVIVLWVLYQREFRSPIIDALQDYARLEHDEASALARLRRQ